VNGLTIFTGAAMTNSNIFHSNTTQMFVTAPRIPTERMIEADERPVRR